MQAPAPEAVSFLNKQTCCRCNADKVHELARATSMSSARQAPSALEDVREVMRAALLPSMPQILDQYGKDDTKRPAQLAGSILLHFWIGACASGVFSSQAC